MEGRVDPQFSCLVVQDEATVACVALGLKAVEAAAHMELPELCESGAHDLAECEELPMRLSKRWRNVNVQRLLPQQTCGDCAARLLISINRL